MEWIYPDNERAHYAGRILLSQYKDAGVELALQSAHMNPEYRPFTSHEKRLWKMKHEPHIISYTLDLPVPLGIHERPVEIRYVREVPEVSVSSLLWLAFLELLNCLSNPEGSGIEGGGKIETPQSTLMAKS